MSSVTIIAFRSFGIPQLRNFSMVGVKICFCNFLVAAATFGHDIQLESLFVSASDGMGTMTVAADRERFISLSYHGRVDAAYKLFLNTMMTSSTSPGNILRVH